MLQNKSPPKPHILPVLSLILDRSNKETPCFHRPVHCPRVSLSQFQEDLILYYIITPSKFHVLPVLHVILDSSKKETSCFYRLVSIQIDSPLPQGVTQPILRDSDFALHNKCPPNLIFYLFGMWFWIALKKETPCFHRPFSIQIDSPLTQGVTQPISRGSDFALHNRRPPNVIFYLFGMWFWIALKKETPCFHRPFSIQIDSPLPQGVTQPVSWESDFSIHNKRLPDFIFYLFACYFGQL